MSQQHDAIVGQEEAGQEEAGQEEAGINLALQAYTVS
jgi:hypothetical protein